MINIDPIDRELGNNMRFLRLVKGLTQAEIGKILGVSFQQVQKYEQGNNRISARTLYKLKFALDVEFQDFFNPVLDPPIGIQNTEHDKITINVIRHFIAIPSLQRKKAVLAFIKELANE